MILLNRILIGLSISAPLTFGSIAFAAPVPSDFAQDVKDGISQQANDPDARAQADQVKADEATSGQVDEADVSVDSNVNDQESNMDDSQTTEAQDAKDTKDAAEAAANTESQSTSETSDSNGGNTANSNTGSNSDSHGDNSSDQNASNNNDANKHMDGNNN